MNAARVRLSTLLRLAAPDIIRALAEEAARSTNAQGASADEYEVFLARFTPRALDAVGADDQRRSQMLAAMSMVDGGVPVRPVPPVARVGLLSIGLRLGREHIEKITVGDPDSGAVLREFDLFGAALRASVAPLAARA
ncbi:MAG TPA: hypothetical protein VJQ09_01505 [Candidatus Limnocylindria bacterium]|nr:hypothetical protein [Candidatus Limnocylindria bacterium]